MALRSAGQRFTVFVRQVQTSATRLSEAKTPIQEWGYKYLQKQKASGRPMAPHMSIYAPQLTWMLSGAHRVAGCVMGGTILLGGIGFTLLPITYTQVIEYFSTLPCVAKAALKFFIAFNITFYSLNGIRLVAFDLAKGTELVNVYRSGWAVLAISVIVSLLVVLNAQRKKKE